jgi:ATP-dependent helicase/nuclease subunit A
MSAAPASMMTTARQEANDSQRVASDPEVSAFVSASAGAGKTKLLTDRLLRLMLGSADRPGSDPARIQCLTFTKAAAAEMSLRLQRVLGAWVTLDDDALDRRLLALEVPPAPDMRTRARALFARVLDLPGGMRIGTIHAFCQSLLRRFPLEAQLSPHFRLLDDTDMAVRMAEAREALLERAHADDRQEALAALTGMLSLAQFAKVTDAMRGDPLRLEAAGALGHAALTEALCRVLGAPASEAAIMRGAVVLPDEVEMRQALARIIALSTAVKGDKANRMLDWLSCDAEDRTENWDRWTIEFLTKAGKPLSSKGFTTGAVDKPHPEITGIMEAEQVRILAVGDRLRALKLAQLSAHLVTLAAPVVSNYRARNEDSSVVDYGDLIRRTSALLVDPGAAWVLYKLDGGIDHLLLDEVQDTAPEQWEIAGALAREFFAGESARTTEPSIFAVGDPKQSIYSFQGADPGAFGHWLDRFRARVQNAGKEWREVGLRVSFRSTEPVLRLVDEVFAESGTAAGVSSAGKLVHVADRAGEAGRVEIWPLAPMPEKVEPQPWLIPDRNQSQVSAQQRLADALADWIAGQVDGSVQLPRSGRTLAAGDVLVLVRRRNAFQRQLTRALKLRGVPVAGLDRMVLTEQPAVADLLSLCDTLLLPQDDLSLACVLTSPLGGLDDDSLLALAAGRPASLWEALARRRGERAEWRRCHDFIATLAARADHVAPFVLLSEALGPLGGRHLLLGRLGMEAAEPIDELLNIAQSYASRHPPSLQGFVHWLRQSGSEVKREAEAAGGSLRIMTVHGAKGLQAPLVILPDTTATPPDDSLVQWVQDPGSENELPVWLGRQDLRCGVAADLRDAARRRQMEEQNRLLYVALTRAEDRLLVCGWATGRKAGEPVWYDQVRGAFERMGAEASDFAVGKTPWEGSVLHVEQAQTVPPGVLEPVAAAVNVSLPGWAGGAPDWIAEGLPTEPRRPRPLAPSQPDGAAGPEERVGVSPFEAGPAQTGKRGSARFRMGDLTHRLLQHLPALPSSSVAEGIDRFVANPAHDLQPGEADRLRREVLALFEHPALRDLLGPEGRSEVPVTGVVDDLVITGVIDRLVVLPDRVVVADYKTNRVRPRTEETVPVSYLRQMSAYRALLREIFPTRRVICVLVWTIDTHAMELSDAVLDAHLPNAMPRLDPPA